jgi:hypothetical protein
MKKQYKLSMSMIFLALFASPIWAASYADDRAEIENLMATYLFAMDFKDADAYVATFTIDGILNHGGGSENGHADIRAFIEGNVETDRAAREDAEKRFLPRPIPGRHFFDNLMLEVDGDTATGKSYWTLTNGGGADRSAQTAGYGHYIDEYRRVDGKWLFSKRTIVNEFWEGRMHGVVKVD